MWTNVCITCPFLTMPSKIFLNLRLSEFRQKSFMIYIGHRWSFPLIFVNMKLAPAPLRLMIEWNLRGLYYVLQTLHEPKPVTQTPLYRPIKSIRACVPSHKLLVIDQCASVPGSETWTKDLLPLRQPAERQEVQRHFCCCCVLLLLLRDLPNAVS